MKALLVVINLLVATLFFTLLYSAVSIDITMPNEKEISYNLNGTNLIVSFPISIKNNGIYPIENLNINVGMLNGTKVIFEHTFTIKKIDSFHKFSKLFFLKIDMMDIYHKLGDYYIFHSGNFKTVIDISAKYWVMADFNATYLRNFEWSPLIYHYQIYYDQISFRKGSIVIPYFISKLPVNLNATMGIKIMDKKGVIAIGQDRIVFDRKGYMTIKMVGNANHLLTNSEKWTIKYAIHMGSFSIERSTSYRWVAPISNIGFSEKINKNLTLYMRFKNNLNRELNLNINEFIIHNGEYENRTMNILVKSGSFVEVPLVEMEDEGYQIYITLFEKDMNMKYTIAYSLGGGK